MMTLAKQFFKNFKRHLSPQQLALLKTAYYRIFPRKKILHYKIYKESLINKYGLEIGGPSRIFKTGEGILPLYSIVGNLDACNFSTNTFWEGTIKAGVTYAYEKNRKVGYQYVCDATDLVDIESEKYDFVLASHVLEHIANPLKAIAEWMRVLKKDGLILLIVPHKDGTFDHRRPVTLFSHLLEDYRYNMQENDLTHVPEILELHDPPLGLGEDFNACKQTLFNNYKYRCVHHHVFSTRLIIEIFNYFNIHIVSIDLHKPYHIIILGKKQAHGVGEDNIIFLNEDNPILRNSPFISDRSLCACNIVKRYSAE